MQVFYNSTNPTAAMVLFTIYEFIMNVLLLNIMIASMTSSFSKVTQVGGIRGIGKWGWTGGWVGRKGGGKERGWERFLLKQLLQFYTCGRGTGKGR